MARKRSHGRSRRRGRLSGLYRIVAVLAIVAAVIAACVVFFRVNQVAVTGSVRYTPQEVIDASGIEMGDNLIALPAKRIADRVRSSLPYVEALSIRRILPDGVEISVRERTAAASVKSEAGSYLISSRGKVLEEDPGQPVVQVVGLTALTPVPGAMLTVEEDAAGTLEYVLRLLTALEEAELLSDAKTLDCTGRTSMELEWGIYRLVLPRDGDYARLLRMLQGALNSEQMPPDTPGRFDFTVTEGEVYFKRSE